MTVKIISTRTHGIMDVMVAPLLPLVPRLLGCSSVVKRIFDGTAVVASANTMATDFEVGLVKEIPLEGHLTIDAATATLLLGAAAVCHDEKRDSISLLCAGLYFLATSTMTKPRTDEEKKEREQRRQRMMARHQLDTPMEEFARGQRPQAAANM